MLCGYPWSSTRRVTGAYTNSPITSTFKKALKESHSDEQRFRDEQLAKIQRLKADIQHKLDALLDRLVDGTITKEVYNAKSEALEEERQRQEVAIYGHEQTNRSYFEQMESFLDTAKSIHRVFIAGSPKQKRQVVQLVAFNGLLTDQKVHLNLKRPCAILAARPTIPYGVTDGIRTRDLLGHSQAL